MATPIIGIIDNILGGGAAQLAAVVNSGAKWTREAIGWDGTDGTGTWLTESYFTTPQSGRGWVLSYDTMMLDCAENGITVLPILHGDWPVPSSTTNFASFAAVVVARYGTGGSFWTAHPAYAAFAPVWFEVWNEPYATWWDPMPDVAHYAALYKATVIAGRAANANVKFLCAACNDYSVDGENWTNWVDDLYTAVPDLNDYLDGYATHPYGNGNVDVYAVDNVNTWFQIENIHDKFVSHGATTQKEWLTEVGWSTWPLDPPVNADLDLTDDRYTDTTQASNLAVMDDYCRTLWDDFVAAYFIYTLEDSPVADPNAKEDWLGLIHDGIPKSAYSIFTAAVSAEQLPYWGVRAA